MRAIDKNTNEIMEVEPYYLHGRIVAYTGRYQVTGLDMGMYAWLPDELITDVEEVYKHEKGIGEED